MKIGDMIAKTTAALGIPHCDECERRRQFLNDLQDTILGVKQDTKPETDDGDRNEA